jgi:hypothetical protein
MIARYSEALNNIADLLKNASNAQTLGPPFLPEYNRDEHEGQTRWWSRPSAKVLSATSGGWWAFLETRDGAYIGDDQRDYVADYARCVLVDLERMGLLDSRFGDKVTAGKLGKHAAALFSNELELRFPFLRLCESHWKTDRLLQQVFPQWSRRRNRTKALKIEAPLSQDVEQSCLTSKTPPTPATSFPSPGAYSLQTTVALTCIY